MNVPLDVVARGPSAVVTRVSRAARAMAARAVVANVCGLGLDDAVARLVAVDKEGEDECEEEENAVPVEMISNYRLVDSRRRCNLHDAKSKASLEHSAWSVYIKAIGIARDAEDTQVGVVGTSATPVRAVLISDAAECVYGANEGSHEEQVDKRDEASRMFGASVEEQCPECPSYTEDRDYEEDEDGCGCARKGAVVDVDEPCKHAHGGDQGEDLHDAP
jgi:hypothetical protein